MTSLPRFNSKDRVADAVLVVFCSVGQAAATALAAFTTRDAFSALHAGQGVAVHTLVELGGASIFAALCLYVAQLRSEALGQSYANALRLSLYRQIARLPKSRHENRRVGALSLRFVGDLSAARLWFGTGLPDILTALVALPGAMAILFALDATLATAGVLPIVTSLLVAIALAWHLEKRHRVLRARRANIAINMIERIAMSPELDLMGRTDKELRALAERGERLCENAVARRSGIASLQATLQAGAALAGLAVLLRGGQLGAAPGIVAASLAVLALLVLPLQKLALAWDRYCAWRVAREKALNLFGERTVKRNAKPLKKPVEIAVTGKLGDQDVDAHFEAGAISTISGKQAGLIARHVVGLDSSDSLTVSFQGAKAHPKTAFIGDHHVGLQGSLRRTATMLCKKRPGDQKIIETLTAYGLGRLMQADTGLDTRFAEAGRNVTADDTLRLDIARADLGNVDLMVVDSVRWRAMPDGHGLLELFRELNHATVLVVSSGPDVTTLLADAEQQT